MKRAWILIAALFALVIVGVNVALAVLNESGGVVTGPDGSAQVTTEHGFAAWRALLDASGHQTRLLGRGLAGATEVSTIVVASPSDSPDITDRDLARLTRFVDDGGTLVWVGDLPTTSDDWWADSADYIDRTLTQGVNIGEASSFTSNGVVRHLSNFTQFDNKHLSKDNNALGAINIVASGDVGFVEEQFGLVKSEATGFDALPRGWIAAFLGMLAAVIIGVAATGRSLGDPDADDATRPPSRSLHVEALASQIRPQLRRGAPAPIPQSGATNTDSTLPTKEHA